MIYITFNGYYYELWRTLKKLIFNENLSVFMILIEKKYFTATITIKTRNVYKHREKITMIITTTQERYIWD